MGARKPRRPFKARWRRPTHAFLLLLSVFLVAALVAANVLAHQMSTLVDAFSAPVSVTYSDGAQAATTDEVESVAEQIESEGIVLLKNDDSALPLSKDVTKVNVFGWASTQWMGGGSGSGGVKETKTGFLQALKDYGIQTNDALSGMYSSFAAKRKTTGTLYSTPAVSSRLYEPDVTDTSCYSASLLSDAKDFSDTAIVVIGRYSGESNDMPESQYKITKAGATEKDVVVDRLRTSLNLSTEELSLLTYVGANYDHVIVVLNTGNTMAVGELETIPGVDAVIDAGLSGENAAKAIPRVLWGDESPSGRTTDTWAYDLSSAPSYATSGGEGLGTYSNATGLYPADGTANGNVGDSTATYQSVSYVDYSEGIYVGYKWYETADAEGYWDDVSNLHGTGYDGVVQYPFGYGLSYTTFSWEVTSSPTTFDTDGDVSFTVKVTNTGSVAGKDVVELYYSPPYYSGGIEKSAVELGAFAKTDTLAPGESQEVTLSFPVYDMASYDCYDADGDGFRGYEIEKGNYVFSLRRDAHTVDSAEGSTVTLRLRRTLQYPTDPTTGAGVANRFTGDSAVDGVSVDGAEQGVTYLSRADFAATFPKEKVASREMPDDVKALNLYTAADASDDIDLSDKSIITGAWNGLRVERDGKVTDLGIQLGSNYADEEWTPLLNELTIDEMTRLFTQPYNRTAGLSSVGKEETHETDGPSQIGSFTILSTGTGMPSPSTLAKTWNVELARREGLYVGSQTLSLGYSGWYAPATNIHRSPLDGRSYEYYSEDSELSGEMTGNVVKGSLDAGAYCYIKHLICADGEAGVNRDGVYTWVTEQALRETYLEPFRIAVERYGATGLMSAYNRIGAVWAGGSKALISSVVRGEWGFGGAIITDFSDHHVYMNGDQALRAGGSLWMNVGGSFRFETRSYTFQRHLRTAAHQVLYMYLNARVTNESFVSSSPENARWARPTLRRGYNPIYPILIALLALSLFPLYFAGHVVLRDRRNRRVARSETAAALDADEQDALTG